MLGIRMTDLVGRLVGAPVATIRPSATLREAASALAADAIGLLVVVDHHGVQGVLSERDVVAAVSDGAELDVERVRDWSTDAAELVSVHEQASVAEAATAMSAADIRHIAVVRGEEVVGILSMRDLLAVALEEARAAT